MQACSNRVPMFGPLAPLLRFAPRQGAPPQSPGACVERQRHQPCSTHLVSKHQVVLFGIQNPRRLVCWPGSPCLPPGSNKSSVLRIPCGDPLQGRPGGGGVARGASPQMLQSWLLQRLRREPCLNTIFSQTAFFSNSISDINRLAECSQYVRTPTDLDGEPSGSRMQRPPLGVEIKRRNTS